jgi:YidC/Oxa1 family membrane protein insertase
MFLPANIFQPLIDVFEAVLKFLHNHVGLSWGLAIVALTILMRAVLLPLTVKQFHSMQKMQHMQPQLKALQAKYKDDKQRQQQELMKFYKENEINPLGSCLPLALQIPVFISLFYMLRQDLRKNICPQTQLAHWHQYMSQHPGTTLHEAMAHTVPCGPNNGAGFLFIPDLTDKATGWVLIVLIALYVGSQLASSLMMSSPMMDPTQRRLMLLLPLFFVVIVINFPAGLLVYWITTNVWTMGQQFVVKRMIGPPVPVTATGAGPPSGGDGRAGPGGGGPPPPEPESNGSSGGGLSGLLRGRTKSESDSAEREKVAAGTTTRRTAAPPPSPRKKKKRSGRRR